MDTATPAATSAMQQAAPAAPSPKQPSQFRDMRLKVGDRVQLEPPQQIRVGRVSAEVVGWVDGECLIVTAPQTPKGRLELHIGETVVMRAFTGRTAFAWPCSVLKLVSQPFDYLFLSFPEVIDGVAVRSSPRCRLCTPAKVTVPGESGPILGQIDNIGSTGASLVADAPLGAIGATLKVDFETVLHDVPVTFSLDATIRSLEKLGDTTRHRHGVSFVDPKPTDRLILAALVWYHMYENPKLSI